MNLEVVITGVVGVVPVLARVVVDEQSKCLLVLGVFTPHVDHTPVDIERVDERPGWHWNNNLIPR